MGAVYSAWPSTCFLGEVCVLLYAYSAQTLTTAGEELNDLDRDLSARSIAV